MLPTDQPSAVVTGQTDFGFADVSGNLRGRITAIGAGDVVGYLPALETDAIAGEPMLAGIPGRWQDLKSAQITVNIINDLPSEVLQSATPPVSVPGSLTWLGNMGIVGMSWDITDPVTQENQQYAVLFTGILFGIWGSAIVAAAQFGLSSWLRRPRQ